MAKKIGYLGPAGTFGEEAARVWLPGGRYIPFPSHLHILEAVENGEIGQGIVAIENSVEGVVNVVLDYFIHNAKKIRVRGEVALGIHQCLFGKPGTVAEDVQMVLSHPTGLGQCARSIHAMFPRAQQVGTDSTAAAVRKMLDAVVPAVAIAGRSAAQEGAVVLRENFQDAENNSTRFWVVGRRSAQPTGCDKTSLVFETYANAPGALFSILALFASRGLNLCRLESRPTKEALGQYVFIVDVEAHQADPVMRDALGKVRLCVPRLKVFGSYARWNSLLA